MELFTYLEKSAVFRESKPFTGLNVIKYRARAILKGRTNEQLVLMSEKITTAIEHFKDEEIERRLDEHAGYLSRRGGWELQHLESYEHGYEPTYSEIYDLLKNWPHGHERPDIPSEDDISDIDALRDMLERDEFYSLDESPILTQSELYALLALLTLERAARLMHIEQKRGEHGSWIHPGEHPWTKRDIIYAGSLVIEAMEILCWAERSIEAVQLAKLRDEQRTVIAERARIEERTFSSRVALDAKYEGNRKAQLWVRDEWHKHSSAYNGNKSEFARVYVPMVANDFNDSNGDPLKITERQMKDVWLSDTRLTRKK